MTDYQENAFTINKLGGGFFPFSFNVSKSGNLISAFVCPQRVADVCDLIGVYALKHLVLFNVDQVSLYDDLKNLPFSLKRIAAAAQIPCSALDEDTLILPGEKLGSLLAEFTPFNLCAFDLGEIWNEVELINQVLACQEHNWQSGALLLSRLPASTIFINSHDDCYLSVQTASLTFIQGLFARTLNLYAGTLLAENQHCQLKISDIPQAVLNVFWEQNFGLTILREATRVEEDRLTIGVVKKPFNFRDEETYVPEFWLCYHGQTGQWSVKKTSQAG